MRAARFLIEGGRHPAVEQALARDGAPFIANDCKLDGAGERAPGFFVVTGPNMAGKSTYLRQNALIAVLAQMGSVCASGFGAYRRVGPAFRAHRRRRRPRARPLHLHGGDDRNRRDPEPRQRQKPCHPRRNRARHRDLRRPFHRLGRARASARRHALPRPCRRRITTS